MTELKPLRHLQLFTKEELEELYENSTCKIPKNPVKKSFGAKSKPVNIPKPSIQVHRLSIKPKEWDSTKNKFPTKPSQNVARKKLFSATQREIVKQPFKVKCVTKAKQRKSLLDDSDPLIDINDKENQIPNLLKFKKSIKQSTKTRTKLSVSSISDDELENLRGTSESSKITSSGEKEFIELEEKCEIKNKKKCKTINEKKILNLLLNESDEFAKLQLKFQQLQVDFNNYAIKCEKNRKEIQSMLCDNPDVNKKVTFAVNLNTSINLIEDRSMDQAINMYNSIRKNCNTLLRTPKADRSGLQTPKQLREAKDGLSIKVQKQCLLLQDTPSK